MKKTLLLLSTLFFSFSALATQPPTQKQIEKYKKDGALTQKVNRVKAFGNHNSDSR